MPSRSSAPPAPWRPGERVAVVAAIGVSLVGLGLGVTASQYTSMTEDEFDRIVAGLGVAALVLAAAGAAPRTAARLPLAIAMAIGVVLIVGSVHEYGEADYTPFFLPLPIVACGALGAFLLTDGSRGKAGA